MSGPAAPARPRVDWLRVGLFLLMAAGAALRIRQYVFNRSLWLDEAVLSLNIIHRNPWELISQSLDYNQQAPFGFLLAVKAIIGVLGPTDLALRVWPLLAGLASLWLAYLLARRALAGAAGQLIMVGLVAFSPLLIYYSTEVKQYGTDVAVTLVLAWLAVGVEHWKHGPAVLVTVGVLAPWLSNSSLFVLAGVWVALVPLWRRRRRMGWWWLVGVGWFTSIAVVYGLTVLRGISSTLEAYWQPGFAPFPPLSGEEWRWYLDSFLGLVYMPLNSLRVPPIPARPEWTGVVNLVMAGLALLGTWAMFRRRRRLFALSAVTVLLTLVASMLELYPFRSRLVLFLAPFAFLALAFGGEWLSSARPRWLGALLGTAATIGALAVAFVPSAKLFVHPVDGADMKGALEYVTANRQPGDGIVINTTSFPAFQFYAGDYGLTENDVTAMIDRDDDEELRLDSVLAAGPGRRWIFITHVDLDLAETVEAWGEAVTVADEWRNGGARGFLIEVPG
jgi:hypothetical protein